eukprot:SAG11_NODE_19545_length_464_cov_1.136986_1_plen_90_part_10
MLLLLLLLLLLHHHRGRHCVLSFSLSTTALSAAARPPQQLLQLCRCRRCCRASQHTHMWWGCPCRGQLRAQTAHGSANRSPGVVTWRGVA